MKKLITEIEYDSETNLPVLTDVFGNTHIVPWESVNQDTDSERYYLQTWVKNFTWSSTTAYNRIPNIAASGSYLTYTVPNNKCYHIAFIMVAQGIASQSQGQGQQSTTTNGLSIIGLFVNNVLRAIVPFKDEIHYKLYSAIPIYQNYTVELKYLPFSSKCDLGIIIGGPLIDMKEHS